MYYIKEKQTAAITKEQFINFANNFMSLSIEERIKKVKEQCEDLSSTKSSYDKIVAFLKMALENKDNVNIVNKKVLFGTFKADIDLEVEGMKKESSTSVSSFTVKEKSYGDGYDVTPNYSTYKYKNINKWLIDYHEGYYIFKAVEGCYDLYFSKKNINLSKNNPYLNEYSDAKIINDNLNDIFSNIIEEDEELNVLNIKNFILDKFINYLKYEERILDSSYYVETICKTRGIRGAKPTDCHVEFFKSDVMTRDGYTEYDNQIDILFMTQTFVTVGNNKSLLALSKDENGRISIDVSSSVLVDLYTSTYTNSSDVINSSGGHVLSIIKSNWLISIIYIAFLICIYIFEKNIYQEPFTLDFLLYGFGSIISWGILVGFWISIAKKRYYFNIYCLMKVVIILYFLFECVILINSFMGWF